jgi:2-phosphosulfolactate phosphatase
MGSPDLVCLVAMGNRTVARTDEDELCAMHLRNLLEGRPGDAQAVRRAILASGEAPTFGDPKGPHRHAEDLTIALDISRYDLAIRVTMEAGRPVGWIERAG